jgi:phospholipase A-2-activating protein
MEIDDDMLISNHSQKDSTEYNLCQQIPYHQKVCRSITSIGNLVLTGSLDFSCGFFVKTENKYSVDYSSKLHDNFVYKVYALKNKKGFLTCGKDSLIILMDIQGNPTAQFTGHNLAVNSLSQYNEKHFISGSWDGSARIWDIESQQTILELKDHSHAVTVCAFPEDTYITASQDKRIRFWKKDQNFKNIDNAHDDIIRDITPNNDYTLFYTCSNDQTIKQWNLSGQNLLTLAGDHDGFIFRVVLFNDFLFSCGDDKVCKVYHSKFFN